MGDGTFLHSNLQNEGVRAMGHVLKTFRTGFTQPFRTGITSGGIGPKDAMSPPSNSLTCHVRARTPTTKQSLVS